MKINRNVVSMIAALAFAGFLAGSANAQQTMAKDARFTLPWTAMWADTTLPAGDYALSVVKLSDGRDLVYTVTFVGKGIKKTIVIVRRPGLAVGKSSMLVAERRGEIYSIRALHLPNADLVLTFPESKVERELAAKAPETMQRVPILVATN